MIICSRTKGYRFQEQQIIVFPIVFRIICNLIIPKQGAPLSRKPVKHIMKYKKNVNR